MEISDRPLSTNLSSLKEPQELPSTPIVDSLAASPPQASLDKEAVETLPSTLVLEDSKEVEKEAPLSPLQDPPLLPPRRAEPSPRVWKRMSPAALAEPKAPQTSPQEEKEGNPSPPSPPQTPPLLPTRRLVRRERRMSVAALAEPQASQLPPQGARTSASNEGATDLQVKPGVSLPIPENWANASIAPTKGDPTPLTNEVTTVLQVKPGVSLPIKGDWGTASAGKSDPPAPLIPEKGSVRIRPVGTAKPLPEKPNPLKPRKLRAPDPDSASLVDAEAGTASLGDAESGTADLKVPLAFRPYMFDGASALAHREQNGLGWTPLTADKMEGIKIPIPRNSMLTRDPLRMPAYMYVYVQGVKLFGARKSTFTSAVVETMVKFASDAAVRSLDFPISPKMLSSSREVILTHLWNEYMVNSTRLVVVGEDINNAHFYQFLNIGDRKNQAPNYKRLTPGEVLRIISYFLSYIFGEYIPECVGTSGFIRGFCQWLQLNLIISPAQFEAQYLREGVPFRNCFASFVEGESKIQEVPYTDKIAVFDNPINVDYYPPEIKQGTIFCRKETKDLIEVISGGKKANALIFRSLIRRVATARIEGNKFQSGFFIYGPPATMKSTVVEILKKVAGKNRYAEFSRDQNQFTAVQLKGKTLLIISDLTQVTDKQYDVVKRVLGRDTHTLELKNDPEIGTLETYCQTVIVSNSPLNAFPLLSEDQAIVQKLIVWNFTPEEQIPAHLQIADMRSGLDMYLVDLLNWALHIPAGLLEAQIRAVRINALQTSSSEESVGLEAFLSDKYWYSEGAFTPITTIATDAEIYSKTTGDDTILIQKPQSKLANLARRITTVCSLRFGVITTYGRSTKVLAGGTSRPSGLYNLLKKTGADQKAPPGAFPLTVINKAAPIELCEVTDASESIVWLTTTGQQIAERQTNILDHRATTRALKERAEADEASSDEEAMEQEGEAGEDPTSA